MFLYLNTPPSPPAFIFFAMFSFKMPMKRLLDIRNIRWTTQWPVLIYWTEQEQLLNRCRHYEKLDMIIRADPESLWKFPAVSMHFLLSCPPGARPSCMLLNSWHSWSLGCDLSWWPLPVSIHILHSNTSYKSKLTWGQFPKRNNIHFPRLGCSWGFTALLSSFPAWLKDISSVLWRKCFLPLYFSVDT